MLEVEEVFAAHSDCSEIRQRCHEAVEFVRNVRVKVDTELEQGALYLTEGLSDKLVVIQATGFCRIIACVWRVS